MRFDSLKDALIHELQDLYSAEKQIIIGLQKVINAVSSSLLKTALENHLAETKIQKTRLERVFALVGTSAGLEVCEATQGLIEEAEEVIQASGDANVKDALLIGACQRIEHYEMAGYGTARAFAKNLGLDEVVDLLQQTLDEEGGANKKLTSIAEDGFLFAGINTQARKVGNI